jgi:hypothetical protein
MLQYVLPISKGGDPVRDHLGMTGFKASNSGSIRKTGMTASR